MLHRGGWFRPASALYDKVDFLDSILFRCSTLRERLSHQPPHQPPASESFHSDDHAFEQWQRAFSPGDPAALIRRLSWDQIDPAQIGSLRRQQVRPSGAWVEILEDALRRASLSTAAVRPAPVPFEELWRPFVDAGRARIPKELLPAGPAVEGLEADLFRRLAVVGAAATQERFDTTGPRNGSKGYVAFVTEELDEGLPVLHDLPVLARALAEITANWIEAASQLLRRLQADRALLESRFGAVGAIVAIEPGLSDPHHRGRTVTRVSFESGTSVAWKPRDVSITEGAHRLFRWLAEHGLSDAPPALTIVSGEGYGWIEWVESGELENAEEVSSYYRRAGSLLLLAHVLNGRDLHMENIIASREGPVLIDAEALMQPETGLSNRSAALDSIGAEISDSVISTGLLSFPQTDSEGRVWDISGFRGAAGYRSSFRSTTWEEINTDRMRRVVTSSEAQPASNIPVYQGEPALLPEWIGSVIEGFEVTWHFLESRRDELVELIEKTMRGPVRIVLRPTNLYAVLLSQLSEPRYLKDAISGDLLIDSLNRVFADSPAKPDLWPMIADEARDLRMFDVPLFTVDADSTTIETLEGVSVAVATRSGLEVVRERVSAMNREEMQRQVSLISQTLPRPRPTSAPGAAPLNREMTVSLAEIESEVEDIALEICREAVHGADGDVNWRLASHLRAGGESGEGGGWYLYEGVAGVALFLAAAGRFSGNDEFRDLSRRAVLPLEQLSEDGGLRTMISREPLGVENGIGSLIYTLSLMSRFLEEPRWAGSAARFAKSLSREMFENDRRLDLEGGIAGTILGLAALHAVSPDAMWVERIGWCADLLISRRTGEGWTTGGGERLTGLAHGTAGIAAAFAEAARLTGQERYSDEAARLRDVFQQIFTDGGWPHTHDGNPAVLNATCHGVVGVALSMMRRGDSLIDVGLARRTLDVVVRDGFHPVDHLCCGNAGRLDFYVQCDVAVGLGDARAFALRLASQMIGRRRSEGGWTTDDPSRKDPSFFRGLSGIGYALLRIVQPQFPSVASFETTGDLFI